MLVRKQKQREWCCARSARGGGVRVRVGVGQASQWGCPEEPHLGLILWDGWVRAEARRKRGKGARH